MPWSARGRLLWRALFESRRVEQELDREMRFHLEMETAKQLQAGADAGTARRLALVAFGGVDRYKEDVRDQRGTRLLHDVASDLRLVVRTLLKQRAFTLTVVLTLAIGIGATAAVYMLVNWTLLRPVPGVARPDQLVTIRFEQRTGATYGYTGISHANLVDVARRMPALSGIAAYAPQRIYLVNGKSPALSLAGEIVAGDLFGVLGVRAASGRLFTPAELQPGSGERVVVISDRLRTRLGERAAALLGALVMLNGTDYRIIGITPPAFRGEDRLEGADLWLPPSAYSAALRQPAFNIAERTANTFLNIIGRLDPNATIDRAETELRAVTKQLVQSHPRENALYQEYVPALYQGIGTNVLTRDGLHRTMWMLFGIVGLMLALACANVGNMLLLRSAARRGEFAMRRALGASNARILQLHLVEGLVVGLAGGIIGALVMFAFARVFVGTQLMSSTPLEQLGTDWRVYVAVILTSLCTAVWFGLVPGIAALRQEGLPHLREAGRQGSSARAPLRATLTVVQLATSMALLVGALLLTRTLASLHRVDLGFDAANVLAVSIDLNAAGYDSAREGVLTTQLLHGLRERPQVLSAAVARSVPFFCCPRIVDLATGIPATRQWPTQASNYSVGSDYFATLRIPVLLGRAFTDRDIASRADSTGGNVVLSRSAAVALYGTEQVVGNRLYQRAYKSVLVHTVIGVVADVRTTDQRTPPGAVIYRSVSTSRDRSVVVLVRTPAASAGTRSLVQTTLATLDPALPITATELLSTVVERTYSRERTVGRLASVLAILAVLLAGVGLYSVVSYGVAQRTREIGIRIALGARPGAVLQLVVVQAARLVVVGLVVGTVLARWLSRSIEHWLFGVRQLDAMTFYAGSAAILAVLAIVACLVPARSAARVDPVRALRHQ